MPLKNFFTAQFELIRLFMLDPNQRVRVVKCDMDLRPLLMKALAGLDNEADNPNVMVCSEVPFETAEAFYDGLTADLVAAYEPWKPQLAEIGYKFRLKPDDLAAFRPRERFVTFAGAMADSLPQCFGSLVLVICPDQVSDPAAFRKAVADLADRTASDWMKYLVIDGRTEPTLDGLGEKRPDLMTQTFHIAPEEIEAQAKLDLKKGGLMPAEVRQYTALLAGFAFARREYADALQMQQSWVEMSARDGGPPEVANASYNLGNTHLAMNDLPAAEAAFGQALDLALDHNLGPLVPMILANLGVTLYRQKRSEQAVQSFELAREHCRAHDLKPTEAHVLDCMGRLYEADGKPAEAAKCWQEALAVYDGITGDAFAEGKAGAVAPLQERLAAVGGRSPADSGEHVACC
jgi:tetratricopeptide (TPR) repeat protein